MGDIYKLSGYFKLKAINHCKDYPWPCQSEPNRTIKLYAEDLFTKQDDGTYFKQTGLGCLGIVIPDDDLEYIEDSVYLEII